MSSFNSTNNSTRPSDDRSQDFQSNPISSGSERQRAVDPSFVNTNELGYDSLNRDKSSLETSAHNILPGHDHSKPLVNEQNSFVNIPGSFQGGHHSTENQGLTGNHHTTDQVQHKSNHGVSPAHHGIKDTVGADIGSNNQYAKNIDESGLYDHTSSAPGRVNPEVSATLKDTRNTIGADYGNNQFQGDSGRQFDTGLHDRNSTGLGSTPAHAASGIREGNHDMSQLIHDIHRTSLDDKSTQNTDHHQGVSGLRADDDISTRGVHNAPMTTSHSTGSSEQFGNQQDSLNTRSTHSTPSGFGRESSHGLGGQTGHHTGLGSGIESQINEYKRDISGPTEHTDVRGELGRTQASNTSHAPHTARDVNSMLNDHELAKPHYGELSTKEVLTDSFGNPPHNPNLRNKLAESNEITDITGHDHNQVNNRNTSNPLRHNSGNSQVEHSNIMSGAHNDDSLSPSLQSFTATSSAQKNFTSGQGSATYPQGGASTTGTTDHVNRDSHISTAPFSSKDNTNSTFGSGIDVPGAERARSTNLHTSTTPSSTQGSINNTLGGGNTLGTERDHSTSLPGAAHTNPTANKDHGSNTLGRDHSSHNHTGDTGIHNDLSTGRSTEGGSLGSSQPTVLDTANGRGSGIPTSTGSSTHASHNDNGLSDATNNTPIHRDASTDAETGTASALGNMLMGKIKKVAGSIIGSEELKQEGQATHSEARQDLHEARDMQRTD